MTQFDLIADRLQDRDMEIYDLNDVIDNKNKTIKALVILSSALTAMLVLMIIFWRFIK